MKFPILIFSSIMQSCAWDEEDTPHKVFVDTEDVRHGLVCGDWLLLARGQAISGRSLPSLTAGTSVLPPSPEKLFEAEKGGGVICQIATDNENEPWRRNPKAGFFSNSCWKFKIPYTNTYMEDQYCHWS